MNKKLRRAIAIIDLVIMIPFIVFLIAALGDFKAWESFATPTASALGCLVLILFLLLKMDEYRTKKIEEQNKAVVDALEAVKTPDEEDNDSVDKASENVAEEAVPTETPDGKGDAEIVPTLQTEAENTSENWQTTPSNTEDNDVKKKKGNNARRG